MGLVDVPRKQFFSFMHPLVYKEGLLPGRISLIVQSGMLSAGFLRLMTQRTIGVAKACSIGNKLDLDECDLLEYLLEDKETDVVALYLESIPRGRRFAEISAKAWKPIVLLKGGKSDAGAVAAKSHTASLSSNARLLESVLEMCGVIMANDFHQMMDLAKGLALFAHTKPACQTAIITFSGGAGILSCDLLEGHGLRVAQLSEKSRKALDELFPAWMPAANPIDLFPAIERHGRAAAYERSIAVILEDPHVDTLFIHYFAGLDDPFPDLEALKRKADRRGKTVVFWLIGRQEIMESFRLEANKCGIAVYDEVLRAVESLASAARYGPSEAPREPADVGPPACAEPGFQEGDLIGAEGGVLDEYDSKGLLSKWDIPVVDERIVHTPAEAERVARDMGYPVVLKGLIPGRIHKRESGLIELGIASRRELKKAFQRLEQRMEDRGRLLLQHQVQSDYELMAGFIRDKEFGPCVMFGLGGTLSELEPDVVFALAPITKEEALKLIYRIRSSALLKGIRGMDPIKKEEMAHILVRLGQLGTAHSCVEEVDINPVVVKAGAPLAVDANIIVKAEGR
jgi:acetyltransferase